MKRGNYSIAEMVGYNVRGQVVRMLGPRETPSFIGHAFGWGRVFSWEHGREVCRRCVSPLAECHCPPIWALQAGIVR